MKTVGNAAFVQLLGQKRAIESLPDLKPYAKKVAKAKRGSKRSCCGGRKKANYDAVINELKQTIAGWSDAKKALLKGLMGVNSLRFYAGKRIVKI